jgi:hypothetical protein
MTEAVKMAYLNGYVPSRAASAPVEQHSSLSNASPVRNLLTSRPHPE